MNKNYLLFVSKNAALIWIILLTLTISNTLFAQAPITNFGANKLSGCAPLVVSFVDSSINNPTNWLWDLGNGIKPNIQNASTTYGVPGIYTVKLITSNAFGSNELVKVDYIIVYPVPNVDFIAQDTIGCNPLIVNFQDLSNTINDTIIRRDWNFGNGNTSTSVNPSTLYSIPGNYNVNLKIT
nr:PKD domain-containing protein [Chitinophagaceae bacterium]